MLRLDARTAQRLGLVAGLVAALLATNACASRPAGPPAPSRTRDPSAVTVGATPAADTASPPTDSAVLAAPRARAGRARATAAGSLDSTIVGGVAVAPEVHALAARRRLLEPLAAVPELEDRVEPEVHAFGGCAVDGSGMHMDPALNHRKNRVDAADEFLPVRFSALTQLRWPATVERRARAAWTAADATSVARFEGTPVVVEGYLAILVAADGHVSGGVHPEGAESPNCGRTAPDQVDWHLWFNATPRRERARSVVIEITPRVRAMHPGWAVARLAQAARDGRRVRVRGWLMLDQEHPEQIHPAQAGRPPTRQTLWEIHPVIEFEVEDDNGEFVALDDWQP